MLSATCLHRRVLTEADIKAIEDVFEQADESSKGYLTRQDLKVAVLNLFGYKPTKYEVDQFMKLSSDGKGLTLSKFKQIMTTKLSLEDSDQEIRQTFYMFDTHCQGFLTLDDVKRAFSHVAPHISDSVLCDTFKSVDNDKDGRLSFSDFEIMMKHCNS